MNNETAASTFPFRWEQYYHRVAACISGSPLQRPFMDLAPGSARCMGTGVWSHVSEEGGSDIIQSEVVALADQFWRKQSGISSISMLGRMGYSTNYGF